MVLILGNVRYNFLKEWLFKLFKDKSEFIPRVQILPKPVQKNISCKIKWISANAVISAGWKWVPNHNATISNREDTWYV